jgi:type IX secretion system PorP/SprF family membrane protein
MKKITLIFFCCFSFFKSFSQQQGLFTQYLYNPTYINPAYSSILEHKTFFFQNRRQWSNIEGTPSTFFINYYDPNLFQKLATGINISNDNIGPFINYSISIDFSASVKINEKWNSALGLRINYNDYQLNQNLWKIYNPNDPLFNLENNPFSNNINIGFGLLLKSKNTYIGISSTSVYNVKLYEDEISSKNDPINYFLLSHSFMFSKFFKISPGIIVRNFKNFPNQYDLSLNTSINDKFSLGVSYRLESSVNALIGISISEEILVGYSYDFGISEINNFSRKNSEVFLKYTFAKKNVLKNNDYIIPTSAEKIIIKE